MLEQQDTLTLPQRRILNLLAIKGVTLSYYGYDRYYLCHPSGPRTFVHMNIANALIQSGMVAVERSTPDVVYVLSDEGRTRLGNA